MQITDKQNKGLFVFDTVFIRTIIWFTLSGSPDNGPDKDSIENKIPFILYLQKRVVRTKLDINVFIAFFFIISVLTVYY
jgi:hypothetical protein